MALETLSSIASFGGVVLLKFVLIGIKAATMLTCNGVVLVAMLELYYLLLARLVDARVVTYGEMLWFAWCVI